MKRECVQPTLGLALFMFATGCASRTAPPAVTEPSTPAPPPGSMSSAAPREPARFIPSSPISGGDGSSVESAVVITAPNEEEGVELEYRWIFDHFGKFRKKSVGLIAVQERHFDEFTFELPDHSEHTIYFDITSFLGKQRPKL